MARFINTPASVDSRSSAYSSLKRFVTDWSLVDVDSSDFTWSAIVGSDSATKAIYGLTTTTQSALPTVSEINSFNKTINKEYCASSFHPSAFARMCASIRSTQSPSRSVSTPTPAPACMRCISHKSCCLSFSETSVEWIPETKVAASSNRPRRARICSLNRARYACMRPLVVCLLSPSSLIAGAGTLSIIANASGSFSSPWSASAKAAHAKYFGSRFASFMAMDGKEVNLRP